MVPTPREFILTSALNNFKCSCIKYVALNTLFTYNIFPFWYFLTCLNHDINGLCVLHHQMDKASLLGDAIAYINELTSKLQSAEVQIKDLKNHVISSSDKSQESLSKVRSSMNNAAKDGLSIRPQGSANSTSVSGNSLSGTKPTIDVYILGQEAMIRINCLKDSYALIHMMMALQELRMEIRHSNTSTTRDTVLHIVIVKVRQRELRMNTIVLILSIESVFFCYIFILGVGT